jgi:hypothetical protein
MGIWRSGRGRRLAHLAMLGPFLLFALLAPAVMPHRTPAGAITLVLCGADGPAEIVIDLATGQPVEKGPAVADERCAWANAPSAALDLGRPALIGRSLAPVAASPAPAPVALRAAEATGLPPATGPPAV